MNKYLLLVTAIVGSYCHAWTAVSLSPKSNPSLKLSANGVHFQSVYLSSNPRKGITFNFHDKFDVRTVANYYGGSKDPIVNHTCLNAYRPSNQSNVTLYRCMNNDPEQSWNFRKKVRLDNQVNGRFLKDFVVIELGNTGLCLNAYRPREGSNVNLYYCNVNDPDQQFYMYTRYY